LYGKHLLLNIAKYLHDMESRIREIKTNKASKGNGFEKTN